MIFYIPYNIYKHIYFYIRLYKIELYSQMDQKQQRTEVQDQNKKSLR